ncbi:TetR/AcrR family transcriptional regulator [Frankia sp. Cas4]|uniref:TetR/AcrR family transcriptional regulator n=1 Tax=Frankia sp. Cas4 TaxID=3073927 RepID=UPI002AD3DA05|nr:TetR/AcrR family transcriptional regulator [Frankia sp. Cas4]
MTTLTSVPREVDTVNMLAADSSRPYHHGRLREALVDAGVALARAGGPEAVVLRAASRAAGVSNNAAYRHFADRDELLRAVCERSMSSLALLMEQRVAALPADPDPLAAAWARFDALGRAYVEFATTEPGWFRTAFAVPRTMHSFGPGEGVGASGVGPYELLCARLDELVEVGAIPPERRPRAEYAAWSAVHGLSTLLNDGPLRDIPATERDQALRVVFDFVARGI